MKGQFKGFIIGFVFACIALVPMTAMADNVQAYFNTANITVNGQNSVKQGESYTLTNGDAVPFSINYKGTTYLPVRKISDLLGISVNYDNATKTIKIVSNSNNVVVQEKTTEAAVTYSTSYSVFNECDKETNNDGKKVAHVVGYKDGSKIDTYMDYSYYKTINSKNSSIQLWKATVDNKNNITKVKTTSPSKTGTVESSGGRDSVTLSKGTYNFENNLVAYKWTDDDEYKIYNGSIKKGDIVNLYDTDGNKKYDVVIFTRDYKGNATIEGDTKNTEDEKADNDKKETEQPKDTDKNKEKTTPKVSSKGYSVINECLRELNNDEDEVQRIIGYKDGRKMDTLTTGTKIVKNWSEPKEKSNGFSDVAVYEIGVSSDDIIVSADKVSADVNQEKTETANERDSVVIGGKTYKLSNDVIVYQVTDDNEYKVYMGGIKDNDIVQLYETDSSKSGYDIVIFSRP